MCRHETTNNKNRLIKKRQQTNRKPHLLILNKQTKIAIDFRVPNEVLTAASLLNDGSYQYCGFTIYCWTVNRSYCNIQFDCFSFGYEYEFFDIFDDWKSQLIDLITNFINQ